MDREQIQHRLLVYRQRMAEHMSDERRLFYETEVADMEADLAVLELVEEVEALRQERDGTAPPLTLKTDCWESVVECFKKSRVIYFDAYFDWWELRIMYRLKFYFR